MKHRSLVVILSAILLTVSACSVSYEATFKESYPRTDTKSRPIDYQTKQKVRFSNPDIAFDNTFAAARMNRCWKENDSVYSVLIEPENYPINASPWYSFRVITKERNKIWVQLNYRRAKHRYTPKISTDRKSWAAISENELISQRNDSTVLFPVRISSDTTWIAAQEIFNSVDTYNWLKELADHGAYEMGTYGRTALGRELKFLDIYKGRKNKKPIVVILGRQHPPETTGFLAMKTFVETLIGTSYPMVLPSQPQSPGDRKAAQGVTADVLLKKYRILFYPLVNPDGVDLGHWRHNSGGIDLNRDWGSYNQPEIRLLCDHIVTQARTSKANVILGLDFHSTQQDIFYTNLENSSEQSGSQDDTTFSSRDNNVKIKGWLSNLDSELEEDLIIEPSNTRPVATSKTWFTEELGATGIIYEVGDKTPRQYIAKKAEIAATTLMKLLILN